MENTYKPHFYLFAKYSADDDDPCYKFEGFEITTTKELTLVGPFNYKFIGELKQGQNIYSETLKHINSLMPEMTAPFHSFNTF